MCVFFRREWSAMHPTGFVASDHTACGRVWLGLQRAERNRCGGEVHVDVLEFGQTGHQCGETRPFRSKIVSCTLLHETGGRVRFHRSAILDILGGEINGGNPTVYTGNRGTMEITDLTEQKRVPIPGARDQNGRAIRSGGRIRWGATGRRRCRVDRRQNRCADARCVRRRSANARGCFPAARRRATVEGCADGTVVVTPVRSPWCRSGRTCGASGSARVGIRVRSRASVPPRCRAGRRPSGRGPLVTTRRSF